jgi:dynein light intermediate chain
MIPPVVSLVKYDKPVLISSAKDKGKAKKTKAEALSVDKKGKALQTEDILNAILPPRYVKRPPPKITKSKVRHAKGFLS